MLIMGALAMISRRAKVTVGIISFIAVASIAIAALGPVTLSVFTPEQVDPNKVVTFSNTVPQTVSGSDLVVNESAFPTVKGTEIHSAIPGAVQGSIHDITSFTVSFNYFDTGIDGPGTVNVNSFGATSNFFNY